MNDSLQRMTNPPAAAAPAAPAPRDQATASGSVLDRIAVLDILRGIALVGMFMVHFNMYEATPLGAEPGRMAAFIERFLGLFVETRFHGIFGMLFGVGFAVQLTRAEARGEPFVARYLRRLAALAVFGFIAEGVFGYNVLFGYAMWGLPLILFRRWPIKAGRAARDLHVVVPAPKVAAPYYSRQPNGMAQMMEAAERVRWPGARHTTRARVEQSGDWKTVVAARIKFMPKFQRQWGLLPSGSFTLFLLGLIGFRLGLFRRPEAHWRLIVSLMVYGAFSGLLAEHVFPIGGPVSPGPPSGFLDGLVTIARTTGFNFFRPQWLAFTYVGAVLLLVSYNRAWLQRLSGFSWAGRMALTNYMMQVVLVDVLFTHHGLGMKIPALLVFPAAIGLFVAQVFMSRWWLTRFRLGPLEWIWRSVTYWKLQPLRIESPQPASRLVVEAASD
jgi:uncharacterized protein